METNVICNFCDNEGFGLKYVRRGEQLEPPTSNGDSSLAKPMDNHSINVLYSYLTEQVVDYIWQK